MSPKIKIMAVALVAVVGVGSYVLLADGESADGDKPSTFQGSLGALRTGPIRVQPSRQVPSSTPSGSSNTTQNSQPRTQSQTQTTQQQSQTNSTAAPTPDQIVNLCRNGGGTDCLNLYLTMMASTEINGLSTCVRSFPAGNDQLCITIARGIAAIKRDAPRQQAAEAQAATVAAQQQAQAQAEAARAQADAERNARNEASTNASLDRMAAQARVPHHFTYEFYQNVGNNRFEFHIIVSDVQGNPASLRTPYALRIGEGTTYLASSNAADQLTQITPTVTPGVYTVTMSFAPNRSYDIYLVDDNAGSSIFSMRTPVAQSSGSSSAQ